MSPPVSALTTYLKRRVVLAAGLIAAFAFAAGAQAGDWATDLGYPAGKKVVILHAHDLGMSHDSNAAYLSLREKQPKVAASAMPPCAWFPHAVRIAQEHPRADIGLQFTLTSEWPEYRWRPMSPGETLRDSRGYYWRSVLQMAVSATLEDVTQELQSQLLHAERLGMRPTHLTTHVGALYARPDLAQVYLDFARRHWIPAVVVDLTPEMTARFRSQGFPIPDSLGQAIEDYPLPKLKDLQIVPRSDSLEAKINDVLSLIDRLPAGLSQIAFAPGQDTPALRAMTDQWEQYVWDLQVFQDQRVRERLEAEDIVLTNWAEVMNRFDGAGR